MMKPSERYKAIEEKESGKQKLLADLAKNKQLANMRQRELNHNYQMHKEGMALKNKELMQNLHTNYFNISSGAVKGVADNTKGDTTKENLYASIADNFSENNMGFLGKAFFKGLAIKERGQRETKESEEKRKVYEDYLNKYGDVIQYLSATNKYAQDLMARQQVKDQAEQEVRSVIDEVGKKNLTEGQSQAAIAQAANNASKKLGEPVIFAGIRQGDGAIIFQDEKGQTVFVENPYYLGQLERQNQNQANVRPKQLDLPNTTPIRFGNRQQQQQSQEPMPQQQQMPNEQQQQEDPNSYDNMELSPNTAYTLPAEGGGTVTLTTDDKGNFGKGFESIREDVYTKLYEKGHIPDPEEISDGMKSKIDDDFTKAVGEVPKVAQTIDGIDAILNGGVSSMQGSGFLRIAKWLASEEERNKYEASNGLNLSVLLEPLTKNMDPNFAKMMSDEWASGASPQELKQILQSIRQRAVSDMSKYQYMIERGSLVKVPGHKKIQEKFAPIFAKYNQETAGQGQGAEELEAKQEVSEDGNLISFSMNR